MEETVTKKVNGVSTGTSRSRLGYIVYDENREDFLAVECAVKQEDEMEDLADQFWAALDGQGDVAETGIVIKGSLELLMGEDLRYYKKNLGSVLDEVPESAYVITGCLLYTSFEKAGVVSQNEEYPGPSADSGLHGCGGTVAFCGGRG